MLTAQKMKFTIKYFFSKFLFYITDHLILRIIGQFHCMKSVHIRSFSSPYFTAFGLITERYGASLRIQSECRKIRTRKTPNTDNFHGAHIKQIIQISWSETKVIPQLEWSLYIIKKEIKSRC